MRRAIGMRSRTLATRIASQTMTSVEMRKASEPDKDKGYLLVTPARNEARNLADVADSIVTQTLLPSAWVIVDDGSTDGTAMVIGELQRKRKWIISTRLPQQRRDLHLHYALVCKAGFDLGIRYLDAQQVGYEFLGLVDADTIVEPRFFEKLIAEFEKDSRLGLASGGVFYRRKGRLVLERTDKKSPRGTGRLWKKSCFFETGGYTASYAPPDVVSNAKAKLLSYRVNQFQSIVAVQTRDTSSEEGLWVGYAMKGRSWHYINAHPLLILMNVIHFSSQSPRSRGMAFFLGYFTAFLQRQTKIEDEELRRYFWRDRPIEVIESAFGKEPSRGATQE